MNRLIMGKVRVNVVATKTDHYGFYVQDIKADGNVKDFRCYLCSFKGKVAVGD